MLPPGTSDGTTKFYGPYDPKVSPDGRRIAYWFTSDYADGTDPGGGVHVHLDDYVTTTPSDRFAGGPAMSLRTGRNPAWINNGRVLTYHPWAFGGANTSTWVPGGSYQNEQWWFYSPFGITDDGELSPDDTKLVNTTATDGASSPFDTLWFWSVGGAAYTGQPPYSNPDPNAPAPPDLRCQNVRDSVVTSPTWSASDAHPLGTPAPRQGRRPGPAASAQGPCSAAGWPGGVAGRRLGAWRIETAVIGVSSSGRVWGSCWPSAPSRSCRSERRSSCSGSCCSA